MKHVKFLIISAVLLCIGLLGLYGYSIWPSKSGTPAVTPTKAISEKQGIGGVPVSAPEKDAPEDGASPTQNAESIGLAPEEVAPRQAAIKKQIAVEYPYRALKTSNDPLPQPAWVTSATKTQTAWDTSTGNGSVVAVIDTGFALSHEDLTSQWYQNSGETGLTSAGGRCWTGTAVSKIANGCDDDNNGYVDDWRGWDFVGVNNTPQAGEVNPTGGGTAHGTEVAGLAGAGGNNGIGTATVSWNNRIMPLQALDDNGSGYTSGVTAAVYYAVDNGAAVINMSLGGSTNDPALAAAVKYAYDRNVAVVAAAGNCGTGSEQGCNPASPGAMDYPALNPYVIAVGATTSGGTRASFSSYGAGLDVVAPGSGSMVSPMWHSSNQTSAYATTLYGTSFASPIVASYVGLIKSIRPNSSVNDITALVNATAAKPAGMAGGVYSNQFGHGIVDAEAGLRVSGSLNLSSAVPELDQAGSNISEHTFQASSVLGSGCRLAAGSYCTVKARNPAGYERYLPYTLTSGTGQAGWTWAGNWLGEGDWQLRSQSGNNLSTTPYQLVNR